MKANRVVGLMDSLGMAAAGDFDIVSREWQGNQVPGFFVICCPGCRSVSPLTLRGPWPSLPNKDWEWNGDEAAPTLSPSINHVGCWHGHLKKGQFVQA